MHFSGEHDYRKRLPPRAGALRESAPVAIEQGTNHPTSKGAQQRATGPVIYEQPNEHTCNGTEDHTPAHADGVVARRLVAIRFLNGRFHFMRIVLSA
jgi:hypothetical protein